MGGGEELTRKIFRSILTVGVAVLACSLLLVMGCFYSFYEGMQEHQLGDELRIAAAAVETNGSTYLEKIKSDRFRVTCRLRRHGALRHAGRRRADGEPS